VHRVHGRVALTREVVEMSLQHDRSGRPGQLGCAIVAKRIGDYYQVGKTQGSDAIADVFGLVFGQDDGRENRNGLR